MLGSPEVVNGLATNGKMLSEQEKVSRLLRSLSEKWNAKVDSLNPSRNKYTMEEIIGELQTYELRDKVQLEEKKVESTTNKGKTLALKSVEEEDDESTQSMEEDDVALISRRIMKYIKKDRLKKRPTKRDFTKEDKERRESSKGVICYKCQKPGTSRVIALFSTLRRRRRRRRLS